MGDKDGRKNDVFHPRRKIVTNIVLLIFIFLIPIFFNFLLSCPLVSDSISRKVSIVSPLAEQKPFVLSQYRNILNFIIFNSFSESEILIFQVVVFVQKSLKNHLFYESQCYRCQWMMMSAANVTHYISLNAPAVGEFSLPLSTSRITFYPCSARQKSIIKIKKGLTDGYLLDLRKLKLWNIKGGLDRQNVFYFNFRRSWFLLLTLKFIICSLYLQSADFNIPRSIEYTMHSKKPQFVFLGQFFWLFQVNDRRYKQLYCDKLESNQKP